MKEKIKDLIIKLSDYPEFDNMNYSLTINYKNIVNDWRKEYYKKFPVDEILSYLDVDIIKSFNFTIKSKYPKPESENFFDEEIYNNYWYTIEYIFYGETDIECQFSFSSKGLSIGNLEKSITFDGNSSISKLIKIGDVYKLSSYNIYNVLNKK